MKHLTRIFLLGTAVLAAAACQREPLEQPNPTYDAETQEVVTNFVFNIATQAQTKQSSGAVQAGNSDSFRGLVDAKLFTYALNDTEYKGILPADATANKIYDLSQLASTSQISWTENRRVLELSLPLKTNTLLFYGRAPKGNAYDEYSNLYDCYGHMDDYTINVTNGSASFKAGSRIPSPDNDTGGIYQKFLIVENLFAGIQSTLLNHYLDAGLSISASDRPSGVSTTYGFPATIPTGGITWAMYATDNGKSPLHPNEDRFPLENKLGHLYKQLTTIYTSDGELRAGSGEATTRICQDLLTVLNEIRCAAPLNDQEAVAKYFANQVYTRILKYFTGNTNNTGAPITSVSFNELATIVSAYLSDEEQAFRPSYTETGEIFWPTQTQLSTITDYDPAQFPFNFNLPRGATHISYDKVKHIFYYPQNFNVSGMGVPGVGDTYNAKSYYYPAELLYFGNSPIRTTASDKAMSNYPVGSGIGTGTAKDPYQWCNDNAWGAEWNSNKVSAATRAVAMQYNINYGVAVLKTQVKFKADEDGYIYDNNHAVQKEANPGAVADDEEPDNGIKVTDNMFALTGIIIGGQPQAIGWDHLPVKIGEAYKYGFIYDKAIPETAQGVPASGTSQPNYTLVYDNFHADSQSAAGIYTPAAHQDKVSVALEFRNDTGKDFYGNHNLIRNGGYFYLIGMLDPEADGLTSIVWPNDPGTANQYTTHVVPPYTADGKSQKTTRIFIQDFMTSVTFTIGEQSLHHAYLTVPDLRSTSMTFGLSVDLNWETGLNFEDIILGAN